jgi:serine/threonine-protein kinase
MLRWANSVLEALMPWAFTVLIVFTQGVEYALASWVPPMLFCALMVSYTARFRPVAPLVAGAFSALTFPALYFGLVHPRLSPEALTRLINQPATQVSRSITLALAGVLCSAIALGIRRVVGRAEATVREQDLFGKYRLLKRVASGGMGVVFEALYCPEGGFERRVAIKRIHPHLAEHTRFVTNFRREAELCARLAHPNIVQVMDFGKFGDSYFFAMELVDGLTLSAVMARCFNAGYRLSPQIVGTIARELLSGLIYAHEGARGADGQPLRVVHRDVCPQNVLLSNNGELKISDFGVARPLREASLALTKTMGGHVAYVAPEQARGEPMDERGDLFPVGVILWELLAGTRLFLRANEPATLMALVSDEIPDVSALRDDIDPEWQPLLLRALARNQDKRFASAREMLAELDALSDSRSRDPAADLAALVASARSAAEPTASIDRDATTQAISIARD